MRRNPQNGKPEAERRAGKNEEARRTKSGQTILKGRVMNAETYVALSAPFRSKRAAHALNATDKALTALFYLSYPLLLVLLASAGGEPGANARAAEAVRAAAATGASAPFHPLLLPCIVAPAIGFALVSLLRRALDMPRPYEALDIDPLIRKDTRGRSFPSKHVFSSFCIASCWMNWYAPAGCALLAAACCIAAIRVVGGVHWPRDVAAGAVLGIACGGIILFW